MAASTSTTVTFLVPGQLEGASGGVRGAASGVRATSIGLGRLKHSVRVSASRGAGDQRATVEAEIGRDVVVVHIAGGPSLVLHPEHARDLFASQAGAASRGVAAAPGAVVVPARLSWRGVDSVGGASPVTRGALGDVFVTGLDVLTDVATGAAADFAASAVVRRFDARVDAGLYRLDPQSLPELKGQPRATIADVAATSAEPWLVLIHGTFSTTSGTFSKLWTHHPQRVQALFARYGHRVFALDHPTLGLGPIENAITLAESLPRGARLHLVTHSRGGLVAEVLARVCASPARVVQAASEFAGTPLEALTRLAAIVADRDLHVDRVVRVACPARGTLLASKRLDAYLSVFKWALELAGVPVAPLFVEFLGEVAARRADPEVLPGLAAQMPDSPLVQWLHRLDAPIPGDLRVVAGDLQGDSVTSWVKTLLADAFYWTDNDLVVQTRSMYGGTPRQEGATFVLDQGGQVSHFTYFANEGSADVIVRALLEPSPADFRPIGPMSWAGQSSTGLRGSVGSVARRGDRPAVVVLPGIVGSHLKEHDERVWLSWRLLNGFDRLAYRDAPPDDVSPDGPIGAFYDDLQQFLSSTHDVIPCAFDWRRPIEESADLLARVLTDALDERAETGQPVRILAHSMGGLVARTVALVQPAVWTRFLRQEGARLLLMGVPNGGSWAPMQVLSGDDTFGNALALVGAPFREAHARDLIAAFPGLIQLQAGLLDPATRLATQAAWQALADVDVARGAAGHAWHALPLQTGAARWGVPSQQVLDRASALQRRLAAQRDAGFGGAVSTIVQVVGRAPMTPDGYEVSDSGVVYLDLPDEGDGRVTLASAWLPGVRVWQVAAEHALLPATKEAFPAYLELLVEGATARLPAVASATRGAAAATHVRSRPSRTTVAARPAMRETSVLAPAASGSPVTDAAPGTALRVSVLNGDLSFVRQPMLLGHYRSSRLTGTERAMDRLLGGVLTSALDARAYPDAPGTNQIFINAHKDAENPWREPWPEAVIVAGLGEEGKLRGEALVHTVRQAVIAWAQQLSTRVPPAPAMFELTASLVGSGGARINAGQSAQLVAQGVREANDELVRQRWPVCGHLWLIELYLDRATSAWRALQLQATGTPGYYSIEDVVETRSGALRRPLDDGYRGADYDFITATTGRAVNGDDTIEYAIDTKRARTEIRAQSAQVRLVRELVAAASSDTNQDAQIGRTLFQLLVPVEVEPFLGGTTDVVLELDAGTAGIPWELLDTGAGAGRDARPWSIRAKLLRRLRTDDFRASVADARADASVLVIGEPACDEEAYPRLPGARDEAKAVADRFAVASHEIRGRVTALISGDAPGDAGPDARAVLNALLARDWRVVHIAGHGAAPEGADPKGVVLSNGTFLGPREIRSMRVVPELVFVNCCHLAARPVAALLRDRARFAAGVAEELIKIGVRCVIAAGWAVDDDAAGEFASTFYGELLKGRRFMDAVASARRAAHDLGGNTWAAYQCYGDPDWTFVAGDGEAQGLTVPLEEVYAGVVSAPGVVIALETLAVQTRNRKDDDGGRRAFVLQQRARLCFLEDTRAPRWGDRGEVAEWFGHAWTELGDVMRAMAWYERALGANDGRASLRVAEQLSNLEARAAWDHASRPAASRRVLADARRSITAAIARLDRLGSLNPTLERETLYGSAFKRLALIEGAAGRSRVRAASAALVLMREHYAQAEVLGRRQGGHGWFYPAMNRLAADLAIHGGRSSWRGIDDQVIADIRRDLQEVSRVAPDFWSIVGVTELALYDAMSSRRLAGRRRAIQAAFADAHRRVAAPWMWASVFDNVSFVLPRYAGRVRSSDERHAATSLLEFVEGFARSTR